mmetsp:Transcript_34944/g.73701  ORF Transcript_34944/g.73701 Transcript_34944/m.73701 type:complete len:222 (+) Transcript_34944:162-827(+)
MKTTSTMKRISSLIQQYEYFFLILVIESIICLRHHLLSPKMTPTTIFFVGTISSLNSTSVHGFCNSQNIYKNRRMANRIENTATRPAPYANMSFTSPVFALGTTFFSSSTTPISASLAFRSTSLFSHSSTYSGNRLQKILSFFTLYPKLSAASFRFVAALVSMLPVVGLLSIMKEYNPINIVEMLHMGFHVSGWKSDMLRHSLRLGLKRPLGVSIMTPGGL